MNMDSKGRGRFLFSFSYAIQGIYHGIISERNLQFHSIVSVFVITLSFLLKLNQIEWIFVLICIFGMIVLELLNTAIERMVDLLSPNYHPLAKQAKDVAAGAVLCYSLMTVIIGCIIFLPKITRIIEKYIC